MQSLPASCMDKGIHEGVRRRIVGLSTGADEDEDRRQLKSILEEAQRRGEQEVIQKLQGLIRNINHPPPRPKGWGDFDLVEPDDGDPPLEFDDGLPDNLMGDFSDFSELMDLIANASESDIRRLKQTRPKGVPAFVFDMLLDSAKKGGVPMPLLPLPIPRPKPQPPTPRIPRRPPEDDPNQSRLF